MCIPGDLVRHSCCSAGRRSASDPDAFQTGRQTDGEQTAGQTNARSSAPNRQTAGAPNRQTAGAPNRQTAGAPNRQTAGAPNRRTAGAAHATANVGTVETQSSTASSSTRRWLEPADVGKPPASVMGA